MDFFFKRMVHFGFIWRAMFIILTYDWGRFNSLNAELNPIRHLLALLGAHHISHVSGLRVKM